MVNWNDENQNDEEAIFSDLDPLWSVVVLEGVTTWPPKCRKELLTLLCDPAEQNLALDNLVGFASRDGNEEAMWNDDELRKKLVELLEEEPGALHCLRKLTKKRRDIAAEVWDVCGRQTMTLATKHGQCCGEALKLLAVLARCPDIRLSMRQLGVMGIFDAAKEHAENTGLDNFDLDILVESRSLLKAAEHLDPKKMGPTTFSFQGNEPQKKTSSPLARGFFFSMAAADGSNSKKDLFGLHDCLGKLQNLQGPFAKLNGVLGYVVNYDKKKQRYVFEKLVTSFDDARAKVLVKKVNIAMVAPNEDPLKDRTIGELQALIDAAPRKARISLPPLEFRHRYGDARSLIIRKDAFALVGKCPREVPSTIFDGFGLNAIVDGPLTLGRIDVHGTVHLTCHRAAFSRLRVDGPFASDALTLSSTHHQTDDDKEDDKADFALDDCFVEGGDNGLVLEVPAVLRNCTILGAKKIGVLAKCDVSLNTCIIQFCTLDGLSALQHVENNDSHIQEGPSTTHVPDPPEPPKSMKDAKFSFCPPDLL